MNRSDSTATRVPPVSPAPRITRGGNPYRDGVQGEANEPITVAATLDRAARVLGLPALDWGLEEVWERLEENAPRIAVITGSSDHPAHLVDLETSLHAAYRLWQRGAVPFVFGIPVMCDGTAQSNQGMSYSLQSREAVAAIVINQMESHGYHGAFVIQGCDKTPAALLCALAHLDVVRQRRGDAPVTATFAPAHVLKGGVIPDDLRADIEAVAQRCEATGERDVAEDLRSALAHILQCSSATQFQGAFLRAVRSGLLSAAEHRDLEKRLSVRTCDARGGICAFFGTGNSSRMATSALGLVHPAVELLAEPPAQSPIAAAVDALIATSDDPTFSVGNLLAQNFANAVRVLSATGASTNLMMHLVAAMRYAGYDMDIQQLDAIRRRVPVPDLFDYSLTQGRDIFALARQCGSGQARGVETVIHSLVENGVPMHLDAPTVTGTTWRARFADPQGLAADHVTDNPIILARPRRAVSGVDVLTGNWLESAVVKISGMPEPQLNEFDRKAAFVLYYENEEEANAALLDPHLLARLRDAGVFPIEDLRAVYAWNAGGRRAPDTDAAALFDAMVAERLLKVAVVISGQGPQAFGMPEMFTPMHYINTNQALKPLATVISDGRYSGVSYGAAIGHVTPEAADGGGILYLRTGDLLYLGLRERRLLLLDPAALQQGELRPRPADLAAERAALGEERLARIRQRRRRISAANWLTRVTDAARGVVPLEVSEEADRRYVEPGVS